MDSLDLEVLKTCELWLRDGHRCELVTVLRTWGSSPRPVGAMLALRDDGCVIGSVSGGCIEDDLIAAVQQHGIRRTVPELVTYGVDAEQAHRFGLPCGGTIELVREPLHRDSRIGELLAHLSAHSSAHETIARQLDLATGAVQLLPARAGQRLEADAVSVTSVHGPRWRLLIIGAGQLSRVVAQLAVMLDYAVTICDPRMEYCEGLDLQNLTLTHAMPDDAVSALHADGHTAIVALTHDPKLDDLALIEALKSKAFYVGALGSRMNQVKRRARLQLFEVTLAQLDNLRGPIGLSIGSKTPAEIAISILAEMTAVKNRVPIARAGSDGRAAIGLS